MKKSLVFLLVLIVFLTVGSIVIGLLFKKDENQKQTGLTAIYDVSIDGDIAYVVYEKGSAKLFVKSKEQPLLQLPVDKSITDLVYSNDGKQLVFAVSSKNVEENIGSELHVLQLDSLKEEMLFSVKSLITEIVFDPKDSDLLFYLQADTYTNYSPIASKRPHDFDVHSYNLRERVHTKHTKMKNYDMASLQVSTQKNAVFVQMNDDSDVEMTENFSSMSQKVFEIPLDNPDGKIIISSLVQTNDIYDFTILPERQEIIYQAVAGTGANGIYEYELFTFNWKTNKTEQLTMLKESASKPVNGPDNKIYFMLDRAFGKRNPSYHLFSISRDGKNIEEIQLQYTD